MIAFGCSITKPDVYASSAQRGIQRAAESDSAVFANAAAGSIARSYNLILEAAAAREDLEAVVLVHQDLEIVDRDFTAKLRRALAEPQAMVVGCVGATGVNGIAWWEGTVDWGSAVYRYDLSLGTEISPKRHATEAGARQVDTLYGLLLALSPWAVRNLRFDEALDQVYGYDFDLCQQARAAGGKVVVADLAVAHHHALNLIGDTEAWAEAHMRVAEKWDGPPPGEEAPTRYWRRRARRAEADAGVARLLAASRLMQSNAREQRLDDSLRHVIETRSWRLTAPLRRANAMRAAMRAAPRRRVGP